MEKQHHFLSDIEEMITHEDSFQKIMADGRVTDEELHEQAIRVLNLLHEVEHRLNPDDLNLVRKLFAETNVLTAVYHYHELQKLSYNGNL